MSLPKRRTLSYPIISEKPKKLVAIQLSPSFDNFIPDKKSIVESFFQKMLYDYLIQTCEVSVDYENDVEIKNEESSESVEHEESFGNKTFARFIKPEEVTNRKIKFKNGNFYVGETMDNIMHGKGVFTWSDGSKYEGDFKLGYLTGKGTILLSDLNTYEGEFCRGYFHGKGIFRLQRTETFYKGMWKYGKRHGSGWLYYNHDNWYEGEWVDDLREGMGWRVYDRGDKYRGNFSNNIIDGFGEMYWYNKDYYIGNWKNVLPHGYGEYTWKLEFDEEFIFTENTWYKGGWEEGSRHGIGVINFGTECGSRYIGKWERNEKHGPALVICGNGYAIGNDPLFENDKPIHKFSKNTSCTPQVANTVLYRKMLDSINEKVVLENFGDDIIEEIKCAGSAIPNDQFINIDGEVQGKTKWCCLEISIHTVPEDVELSYYVEYLLEILSLVPGPVHFELSFIEKCIKSSMFSIESAEGSLTWDQMLQRNREYEQTMFKNYIKRNVIQLKTIYNTYASITAKKPTNKPPTLVRLFLWQLLRDVEFHRIVPIVEADEHFAQNPASFVDSNHNPFERIYLWQFLQYLIGCSLLVYNAVHEEIELDIETKKGVAVVIFDWYLNRDVYPNVGRVQGLVLADCKDLLPIKSVYNLYLKLEEPLSVKSFLKYTCIRKGENPLCIYSNEILNTGQNIKPIIFDGFNAVFLTDVAYLKKQSESFFPRLTTTEEPKLNDLRRALQDNYSKTMFTFRKLGKKKILSKITEVCPKVAVYQDENKPQYKMDYRVVFLEFYEILLLLSREKFINIEGEIKEMEAAAAAAAVIKKSVYSASSISSMKKRDSKRDSKRKFKSKKSIQLPQDEKIISSK